MMDVGFNRQCVVVPLKQHSNIFEMLYSKKKNDWSLNKKKQLKKRSRENNIQHSFQVKFKTLICLFKKRLANVQCYRRYRTS